MELERIKKAPVEEHNIQQALLLENILRRKGFI